VDITQALPLLGGLSPQQPMKRQRQKCPLLVRQAIADFKPILTRLQLFELAANEDSQARLLTHHTGDGWKLRYGPSVIFSSRLKNSRYWKGQVGSAIFVQLLIAVLGQKDQ
jgi:ribosomal protein L16 Arg81 hydroxylase